MSATRLSRLNDGLIELEKRVDILERLNQSTNLRFGQILLNGDDGKIQIFDDDDNLILELNEGGMRFYQQQALGDIFTSYWDTNDNVVGATFFGSYSGSITEFAQWAVDAELASTRLTYHTLEITDADFTRLVFFQFNYNVNAGVFSSADFVFSLSGASSTFAVRITNTSGGGYLELPALASDPGSAISGSLYYNTSSNKLKVKEGGSWRTVTTT